MINKERLKELRINKGLTQEELASALHLNKSSICCYENENRCPSVEVLIDLCAFFGVSADYILGNDKLVEVNETKELIHMTKEEVKLIRELKKDKYLAEILLEDASRSIALLKGKFE